MSNGRTILVSNRLPVTAHVVDGAIEVERSVGGLATALSGARRASDFVWVGWPGDLGEVPRAQRAGLNDRLVELGCVPVALSRREIHEYYESVSNGVLWPLFHYQPDRMPIAPRNWETYAAVNERFADAVAGQWRTGDDIWVHDYQLMLVPALLRRRLPSARIGFFLHIPFPAIDVFRILPWRTEVLEGILGADLVGMHTREYAQHFTSAATALSRAQPQQAPDRLHYAGRDIRVGAFPIGIDARDYEKRAAAPAVRQAAGKLKGTPDSKLIAGVDRLDYTKGIPQRILAFQRLLEQDPELHGKVRLIQVVVPSRTGVRSYREFRTELDAMIGHINGSFGTPAWTPVTYQYRALAQTELLALYAAADVMFVTPVRDGMNLVAKEYVAVRSQEDGVLVLSEFAGAAEELREALLVNPFNIDRTAATLERALTMPLREQQIRMMALRRRVFSGDAARWANRFLSQLHGVRRDTDRSTVEVPLSSEEELESLSKRVRRAPARLLLLDYDGTLVRFTSSPGAARPDKRLKHLLAQLADLPSTSVHVVSGRSHESLGQWLGDLPIGLHAEHGLWSRSSAASGWRRRRLERTPPYDELNHLMQEHARKAPGALVERKSVGMAWHYRMANERLGEREADRLRRELEPIAEANDLQILEGNKVLEVRPRSINKGTIVGPLVNRLPEGAVVLAVGDDRTDEDLFAALPPSGASVHVGPMPSRAAYRVPDVKAAREFLESLTRPVL